MSLPGVLYRPGFTGVQAGQGLPSGGWFADGTDVFQIIPEFILHLCLVFPIVIRVNLEDMLGAGSDAITAAITEVGINGNEVGA